MEKDFKKNFFKSLRYSVWMETDTMPESLKHREKTGFEPMKFKQSNLNQLVLTQRTMKQWILTQWILKVLGNNDAKI
jgi:hypothetical protein